MLIAISSVSVFSGAILGTEDKELPADGGKGIIPLEMPLFVGVAEGSEYYDFRYPNADKLMIVADAQWNSGTDTFNIKLPSDFVFYDRSYSHYAYDSEGSTMKIDGNEISSLEYCRDSSRWQSGQLSPTQLSLDDFHTVSLRHDEGYPTGHSCAAIVLIYREA